MNVDQMNHAEKQVYWAAFHEQRATIDQFRTDMFALNPEWLHDSQSLLEVTNHVFEGHFEHEFALKAVATFRAQQQDSSATQLAADQEFALQLQEQFNAEFIYN